MRSTWKMSPAVTVECEGTRLMMPAAAAPGEKARMAAPAIPRSNRLVILMSLLLAIRKHVDVDRLECTGLEIEDDDDSDARYASLIDVGPPAVEDHLGAFEESLAEEVRLGIGGNALVAAHGFGNRLDLEEQPDGRSQVLGWLQREEVAKQLAVDTADDRDGVLVDRRTEARAFDVGVLPVGASEGELAAGGNEVDEHTARAIAVEEI